MNVEVWTVEAFNGFDLALRNCDDDDIDIDLSPESNILEDNVIEGVIPFSCLD